jgi:hypothetical protein
VIIGCSAFDGGCPPPDDGGALACVQCMVVDCASGGGRLTEGQHREPDRGLGLGAYLQGMAEMESLAVQGFQRLAAELGRLQAPLGLVRGAKQAVADERRHARALAHLATEHGAPPRRIPPLAPRLRAETEIARENVFEGCIRETWGAAVLSLQAEQARHTAVRRAFKGIARDEARHAELSWDVAAWFGSRLGEGDAGSLRAERARALARVRPGCFREPADELHLEAGLPTAAQARALWAALQREVWVP